MAELNTGVEGIGHLLADRLLRIPDYQRSYSWEDDQISELWSDFESAIRTGTEEYFLGSIVTTRRASAGTTEVIDGQQRLATVSLMYAGMRDIFEERSDVRATEIQRDLLGKPDIVSRIVEQRLVLNADDNELFRQITLEPKASRKVNPTLPSHKRLVRTFEFFTQRFLAMIQGKGPKDWQQPLLNWYQFVLEKAKVIEVSVSNESRAFVIFETLNARGLDLSTSDLVKNHLFGMAGKRLGEAKTRWERMTASLTASDLDLQADTFLRQYWASQKGVVRVKALFTQMRPEIKDPASAVHFVDDLSQAAPLWSAMFDRDAEMWRKYPRGTLDALITLRELSVEQCRPLLLAALRRFPKIEIEKLLSLILGWSIRWFVVGGGSGGTVERLYAESAKEVTDGKVSTSAGVSKNFKAAVPDDLVFRQTFEIMTVRRGWLARYYLLSLERAKKADPEPELVPNENVQQVNLEHVLPKNPGGAWAKAFSPEEMQSMKLMLGNQVLLKKSHNDVIGNKPFTVKKPILAKSEFELTKEVGNVPDWTPQAIKDRQARMAKLAVRVWRKA